MRGVLSEGYLQIRENGMNTLFECHGHLMMDGSDYAAAKKNHEKAVNIESIRRELKALQEHGVVYFRDGGDAFGVGKAVRHLAEEYGVEYVTPVFAIHRKGRYGWIVGRDYETIADYRKRLAEVREEQGDFVKLIVSGIITFREYGGLSCESLGKDEITELIHIAHGEGYAVMIHVNGPDAIRACVEAGADSIEHGYFADEETLQCIAEHNTIWVPTIAATQAFVGRDGFDEAVARETVERQMEAVRFVTGLREPESNVHGTKERTPGAKKNRPYRTPWIIAPGSDSGAVGVPHGPGTVQEYSLLAQAGLDEEKIRSAGEALRMRFRLSRHNV